MDKDNLKSSTQIKDAIIMLEILDITKKMGKEF